MYLRTPKRYRTRRRRLRLFSARTVLFIALIPFLAWLGWVIWENQGAVRDTVLPEIESFAEQVQTQVAPKPTPSATPDIVVMQANCLNTSRQGNIEDAIVECRTLAENSPNDVGLHFKVAHMLIVTSSLGSDAERLDEAVMFAEQTINASPERPDGWAIRAMALDWQGEYGRALASALHAKSLDDTYAPTYAFLGEIYQDMGQYELASTYLDRALELDTGGIVMADIFRNRGLLLSNQGDWVGAIQPYQAALRSAPNYTYIAIELANNYIALGQIEEALAILSEVLESNPTDPAMLFSLGTAHYRNGNKERAYEYYVRCLESDADNIKCLSFLGGLQWSEGDFAMAVENLQRAIMLGSDDPDDFYQLGHSLAAMGRCAEAVPYLQQGYQMVIENGQYDKQARIANQLQSCGVRITDQAGSES
jgi:tetratricopeptide (TPR) repeat protein